MTLTKIKNARDERRKTHRPAPLLPIAVGLILGITLDDALALSPLATSLTAITGLLFAAAALRHRRETFTLVVVIVLSTTTGIVRHAVRMRYLPANHIARFLDHEPCILSVTGRIITAPRIIERRRDVAIAYPTAPKTRFLLDVASVAGAHDEIDACGRLHVTIKEPMPLAQLGDEVRITGRLYPPMPPDNPGMYDWALMKRREGVHAALSTDHAAAVVTLNQPDPGYVMTWLNRARDRARQFLLSEAVVESDPAAGVLTAMILGQRSQVDQALNEAFVRTGAAHYLAASGLHVGWLALIGWWICRLCGRSNRQCAVIVALLIIAYVLLAEPRPSIMRAGAIGVLACFGIFRAGRANTPNWLAAAAILLLMIDPTDVFRPAFQFSFVAVLSIVYLRPLIDAALTRRIRAFQKLDALDAAVDSAVPIPLTPKLPRRRELVFNEFLRAVRLTLTASIAVWIANVPLASYHFNRFAPFGWFYNLLLWLPAFVVTAMGFIKVLLALVFPSSAVVTGPMMKLAVTVFLSLVQTLADLPGGLLSGNSPSLAWVLVVYAVIMLRIGRPEWFDRPFRNITIYAVLVLWWLIPARWAQQDAGALNVWMLAIGDGSGTIIELPDGRALIFDFGTRSPLDASVIATAFLEHRAIPQIDTAFVTHANFDHYGAIEPIHRDVPIQKLVIADQFKSFVKERSSAARFLDNMRKADVEIETFDGPREWQDPSGVYFEVLAPPRLSDRRAPSANDSSLALRMTYQGKSVLLTGDQAEWGLGHLLALDDLHADILALPHHGSVVHNTGRFIDAVDPEIAIRSTGQRQVMTTNGIDRLVGNHRTYLSTADQGCIRIRIKNHKVEATPFIQSE